ncbi:MAG: DUF4404 family protein [Chloroflexota bacterium]
MSDDKPTINISGSNVQGGIVGIGGTQNFQQAVTLTLGNLSSTVGALQAPDPDKAELQKLIAELEAALKNAPAAHQDDAKKIAKRAKEAVEEAAADHPDKDGVEAKANLLKKAAENVAGAMPIVLTIATSIVAHLLKLGM